MFCAKSPEYILCDANTWTSIHFRWCWCVMPSCNSSTLACSTRTSSSRSRSVETSSGSPSVWPSVIGPRSTVTSPSSKLTQEYFANIILQGPDHSNPEFTLQSYRTFLARHQGDFSQGSRDACRYSVARKLIEWCQPMWRSSEYYFTSIHIYIYMYIVYLKYAHCYIISSWSILMIYLLIFLRAASWALGRSYDFPSANEVILKNMGKMCWYQATTRCKLWACFLWQ